MTSSRRQHGQLSIPLKCALFAFLVAAVPVWAALQAFDGAPSGLLRMANSEPLANYALEADPDFKFVDIGAHYDGVYYYAMARDPFATGEAHALIDKSGYRYGHAGYGWLAGLVSLGNPTLIPAALVLLSVAGLALAAWGVSTIFEDLGVSGWWGLTVGLNPGLIYATTASTSEPVGAAVLAGALLFWMRNRIRPAAALLVALCFLKEPFTLVPVSLGGFELLQWLRGQRRDDVWQRIGLLAIGPFLFAIWYTYLHSKFGQWPFQETDGFFQLPFAGWIESIRQAAELAKGPFLESQLGAVSGPLVAVAGALVIIGFVRASRLTSPIHLVFIPLALIPVCLSPLGVLYPKDLVRELAIALLLVPLVLAASINTRDGPRLDENDIAEPAERQTRIDDLGHGQGGRGQSSMRGGGAPGHEGEVE